MSIFINARRIPSYFSIDYKPRNSSGLYDNIYSGVINKMY